MGPWGGGDQSPGNGGVAAPAERALLFISKSLLEVQKGANRDLKLMKQRAKSFRDLATSLDKEWEKGVESFKVPLTNVKNSQTRIMKKIRESGSLTGPSLSAMSPLSLTSSQGEDKDFLKNLKPNLSSFRRVHSDPNFQNRLVDEASASGSHSRDLVPTYPQRHSKPPWTDWTASRRFPESKPSHGSFQGFRERRKGRKKGDGRLEDWEPLRRARKSVTESFKELESTAATSKTPSEFFENVKKTEFFENVKKNLKLTPKQSQSAAKTFENDVAPLDVPELLENLVRQSGPFLDHIGVKKDVADKVCESLRSYRRKDQAALQSSCDSKDITSTCNGQQGEELDRRIASVIQSTGYKYKGGLFGEKAAPRDVGGKEKRNIAIVTTASLPWMTGTAINPLFRAAFLAKLGKQNVTLLVPWLCRKDQELVYPNNTTFESPQEQEAFVRNWVEARVGFRPDFKIAFYPGKFSLEKRSILAAGDVTEFIPGSEADVAVLEEPEHLNWYHHGKNWTDKFEHVVGVVHTNYLEYVRREKNGVFQAFLLKYINECVCRAFCNKVIRLSGATQELPKSSICNIHGVNPQFLDIGERLTSESRHGTVSLNKGAYFLGKMLWGKGYRELVNLLSEHKSELGNLSLDVYGTGEDSAEVQAAAKKLGLSLDFHKGRDHADEMLHGYKVFINPSMSDVVCTTTAEALAMGKIVVCADHPSNEFFRSFPNCYIYSNPNEFVAKVKKAMASDPVPLSPEQRHLLSWEAATDRFLDCAELEHQQAPAVAVTPLPGEALEKKRTMAISQSMPDLSKLLDRGIALGHNALTGMEPARLIAGALGGTIHYGAQHCKDLGLPPPSVQRLVYGW